MTFQERFRAARHAQAHTQTQAAAKVRVAVATLARWEIGWHTPQGLQRAAAERYIKRAGRIRQKSSENNTLEQKNGGM